MCRASKAAHRGLNLGASALKRTYERDTSTTEDDEEEDKEEEEGEMVAFGRLLSSLLDGDAPLFALMMAAVVDRFISENAARLKLT